MTKPTIVTRVGKGSPLSIAEGDSNFTNLRDSTIGVLANGTTVTTDLNGSFEIEAGSGITVSGNNSSKKITITNSQTGFSGSYNDLANQPTLFSGAYADLTGKPTNVSSFTNDAGYLTSINSGNVTAALGFTPESTSNKNQANGYVGLDGSSKISSTYLPSYVDDVVEAANYAGLPGTGESGKIYVTVDTNKTYRWSGSAYIEISASPGTTDALTEGTTNFYFSTTRARAAVSGSGDISYNASTGVFSYTGGSLPLQTGNSGKFLTTNGSTTSWGDVTPSWYGVASSLLNMGDNHITGTANSTAGTIKFGPGSGTAAVLASNSQANLVLATDSNSISDRAKITLAPGLNGNITIATSSGGTGKVELNGPLLLTATSGTPSTYNTSYFEGTLDTPAAWFKVTVGASTYYLPMFQ